MVAGLMDAQLSNDPDGDRWTRHLNRLVDLYVDDATQKEQDADDAQPDHAVPKPACSPKRSSLGSPTWSRRSRPTNGRRRTDCTDWDVRKVVLHVLGSADAQASFRSSCTNYGGAFRSTRRSTPTTGSTA